MAACEVFDPHLPHQTADEQTVWLARWTSNLLNSSCLQDRCSTVCLPGHSPLSIGCLTCLQRQGCSGTYNCLHCLGGNPETLTQFEPVYQCTVDSVAPATVAGLLIGVIFGVLLLVAAFYSILWKTGYLPTRHRLATDHSYFTGHEQHSIAVPEMK